MPSKIKEIIVEPNKIYVGSTFKLKIKAARYTTYNELRKIDYFYAKTFKYGQLKGE